MSFLLPNQFWWTWHLYFISTFKLFIVYFKRTFVSISSLFSDYVMVIYLMQQLDDKMEKLTYARESQKLSRVFIVYKGTAHLSALQN